MSVRASVVAMEAKITNLECRAEYLRGERSALRLKDHNIGVELDQVLGDIAEIQVAIETVKNS